VSRSVVVTKNFTGTDGDNLSADSDWLEQNAFDSQLRVISNGFHSAFTNVADVMYQGASAGSITDDQYVQVTVLGNLTQSDWIGINLRNSGGDHSTIDNYRVYHDGNGHVKVDKVVNASATNLASITQAFTSGDKLSAEATGSSTTTIRVYQDTGSGPVQIGSDVTDSSSPLTTGGVGVTGKQFADTERGDDFEAGNVVTAAAGQPTSKRTGGVGFARGDSGVFGPRRW
jgi:hypothetical protein